MNEPHDKSAIVLGGTSPHVKLIEKLKGRGYYTILVDYLKNSPCVEKADEHVRESTLDVDKVLEAAKNRKVDLVISTCIDQANSVCCQVAERLGLPRPYSYQTSLNVTNKGFMKKIMWERGIPTSSYMLVKSRNDIVWEDVHYPVVVKPVDCNSSKGVRRADDDDELRSFVDGALGLSRSGEAIIERFNEGEEIQVDCFAGDGGVDVVMTRQKRKVPNENGMVLQSYGSLIPAPIVEGRLDEVQMIAEQIAEAFGLANTPFFYQAIVTTEGIQVLEFAPRIGGGLSYYLIEAVTGFDVVDAAIDSFLGKKVSVKCGAPKKMYATHLLYVNQGVFDHIEGMERLKREGVVKEFFQMKKAGAVIDRDMSSGNRVGAFVVEAESDQERMEKASRAYGAIEVYDDGGRPMLKRHM